MELRRFFRASLLLVTVAVLLLLFVLDYANPGNAYQQVGTSQIVKLIDQGEVKVALITYKNQTIQVTTKNGKNLEASWSSGQGPQLQDELQQQYSKGNLPDGYNVNIPKSNALLDLLPAAFIYIVSFLLFSFMLSLYLLTAGPFRGGQPAAIGLPHDSGIAHGASCRQSSNPAITDSAGEDLRCPGAVNSAGSRLRLGYRRGMGSDVPGLDAGTRQRLTARFGSQAEAWFGELPGVLAAVAQRWPLAVGSPIPRGSVSAVYWCRMADGRRAVLKASPDRARLAFEAAALGAWHTVHTPAVIALDEQLGALLLEAIEPGTPLDLSSVYPAADSVAELLSCLHESGVPDPSYPVVGQRVAYLFGSSAKLYDRHSELTVLIPPKLYERGHRLATRLTQHDSPVVLLHGDLTPGNILGGGAGRGLVAIDPAPCLGDPAFDAVDLILWQAEDLKTIKARIQRLVAPTGMGAQRLVGWCTAFAAMSALELASGGNGPGAGIQVLVGGLGGRGEVEHPIAEAADGGGDVGGDGGQVIRVDVPAVGGQGVGPGSGPGWWSRSRSWPAARWT